MRLRSALVGIALCFGAAPAVVGTATVACAAEGNSAVLVVDTGESSYRYCVGFSSSSVSGIELIRLASEQHGLQYSLGFGGQAVCRLQGVGPDGDDCFADDPYFWGYWHGTSSGGWSWSSTGAGSYRVEPGDVEGWSWGTGQSGDTHPQPPPTTYGSVCATGEGGKDAPPAERPAKGSSGTDRKPPAKRSGDGATAPGAEAAAAAPDDPVPVQRSERPRRAPGRDDGDEERRGPIEEAGSPSLPVDAEPDRIETAAPGSEDGGGVPAAGIAALVAALALAGAAGAIARRRRA